MGRDRDTRDHRDRDHHSSRHRSDERGSSKSSKVPIDRKAYIDLYGVDEWNEEYDKQEKRWRNEGIYPRQPFNIYILRDRHKTTTGRDHEVYDRHRSSSRDKKAPENDDDDDDINIKKTINTNSNSEVENGGGSEASKKK